MNHNYVKPDNFRDLGGMSAADGRKTAPGRLLRSGELSNLKEHDIRILGAEYHITNIVDLRTKNERQTSPDCIIPEIHYFILDFFPNQAAEKSTGSEEQLKQMQSAEQTHKNMEELYTSFIMDRQVKKQLYEFLQLLLRTETGATLFHCYAGKDRTGITAAVVLKVLGVSQSDIMKDYLETNIMRQNMNEIILDSLKKLKQPENIQEAVMAALCVEQRYLEIAFETAEREYGSFQNYIAQGIGLSEADWHRLRTMYLA